MKSKKTWIKQKTRDVKKEIIEIATFNAKDINSLPQEMKLISSKLYPKKVKT